MHTEPRSQQIVKLVVHTNEGPEGANHAQGLADYLWNNGPDGGGYNADFDDTSTVTIQADNVECWANGAVNGESLDGCIIGYAAFQATDWGVNAASIERAAQWFASKCLEYSIPPVHLTGPVLLDPSSRGICGHGDLTAAGYPGTQGHTDPGPDFPWGAFIARVAAIVAPPAPKPSPAALRDWLYVVSLAAHPAHLGDTGGRVAWLQGLLLAPGNSPTGTDVGITGQYGPKMAAVVARYKVAHKLANQNGNEVGAPCALKLLSTRK